MLGAKGVQLGTRFLVARNALSIRTTRIGARAKDIDTIVSGRAWASGAFAQEQFSRQFLKNEYDNTMTLEEMELRSGSTAPGRSRGRWRRMAAMAGQIAGIVKKEQSCAEIMKRSSVRLKSCSVQQISFSAFASDERRP